MKMKQFFISFGSNGKVSCICLATCCLYYGQLSALGLQMAKFLVNFGRLLFVWWVTLNVANGKAVGIFS